MSDSQTSPSEKDVDDELKLALMAAFGDDAINLMDDDDDEIHADGLSSPDGNNLAREINEIVVDDDDGPLIRFVKELNRAIYSDGKSDSPNGENGPNQSQQSTSTTPRFVLFVVGDQQFGVPLTDVREIARYPKVTELPRTPSWLRGITNIRGQVLSVTDLRNLLQLASERPAIGEKILIVHSKTYAASTAIVVDRVIGIRNVSGEQGTDSELTNNIGSIVSGTTTISGFATVLIDIDQLFGCAELLAFAT